MAIKDDGDTKGYKYYLLWAYDIYFGHWDDYSFTDHNLRWIVFLFIMAFTVGFSIFYTKF